MTDSAIVHYSGRWAHRNGSVAAGALLSVYDAGTSNLASIFTDSALTTPSANPITADADGLLPFAWIGTSPYKVRLTTSGGTLIDEQDNISGALNTAPFLAGEFAKPDQDFNSKTGDYTVVADDLGTIINCDCSGGAFDITMMSAITATNGKGVTIRHVGTANTVGIVTVSSQTITSPTTGVTTTAFELISYGESVTLESDGANWHVTRYVPPLLRPNTPGVIKIADRVSAAPSSSPGTRYIVSGAFSTFEQEDIIEDNGQGGFIEITPPTDCGWVAYVQDEDRYYTFRSSAWVLGLEPDASASVRGMVILGDAAAMEALTADRVVQAALQHRHPGHPKAWGRVASDGSLVAGSYNVTSAVRNGAGDFTVTLGITLANTNYVVLATAQSTATNGERICTVEDHTTTTFRVRMHNASGTADDAFGFAVFGDL
jgi:hypothetical protein